MALLPHDTQEEPGVLASGPRLGSWLYVVFEVERPLARGARFSLEGVDEVVIGRGLARGASRENGGRILRVGIPSPWLSTRHVRLVRTKDGWSAVDLASRNGTFVEGRRVEHARLADGDLLEAGRTFLVVGEGVADKASEDDDAELSREAFGLRTLLPSLRDDRTTLMRVVERSSAPILVLGPTGSGKELVARAIHERSGRRGAFVAVNCGALPAALVEGMLFGHRKGAFSGALRDELGFVRAADGGTLFLDEIADLPAPSQTALLRTLQEGEVVPLGSTTPVQVDLRVVAATHRPVETLLAEGSFRADLLARLRGYTHRLPALRQRREDIGLLFGDILARVAGADASRVRISVEAARALLRYEWPLNVRELHQCIVTAVALAPGGLVDVAHLPESVTRAPAPSASVAAAPPSSLVTPRDVRLRGELVGHLAAHHGNVAEVARAMGKAPAQIHRWMKRLAVDANTYRDA